MGGKREEAERDVGVMHGREAGESFLMTFQSVFKQTIKNYNQVQQFDVYILTYIYAVLLSTQKRYLPALKYFHSGRRFGCSAKGGAGG